MPEKRKTKTKLRISAVEIFALMRRIDVAAKEGNMLSLMMPNCKLLADCTRKDLTEIAKQLRTPDLSLID